MENSKIAWTDHTFNPWIGCTKIAQGCVNCYAENLMDKRFGVVEWGPHGKRKRTSPQTWNQVKRWNREAKEAGVKPFVFVGSLMDIGEQDVMALMNWRIDLWKLIYECDSLVFLLLTKRFGSYQKIVPPSWQKNWPSNVWAGVSVDGTGLLDRAMYALADVPAPVRFLSAEPLLTPLHLQQRHADVFDWIIVGGESGQSPRAIRPMNPDWARQVRDFCDDHDKLFFMKQMGAWRLGMAVESILTTSIDGSVMSWVGGHGDGDAIPDDLRIQQRPKPDANFRQN